MDELKGMGEGNASTARRQPSVPRRSTLLAAAAAYHQAAAAEAVGLDPGDPALEARSSALALAGGAGVAGAKAAALSEPGGGLADTPVTASFQVIHMIGWAPAATQQTPDKRGSATRSLSEISITSSSPSSSPPSLN